MKTVCSTNPVIFVKEVCEAIKDGWRFNNTNLGSITETSLLQVILFDTLDTPHTKVEEYKYEIVEHDKNQFMLKVQDAILSGMSLDIESVDWYVTGIKTATFYNMEHPKAVKHTYQSLESMEWQEFKDFCKTYYGLGGRNRQAMIGLVLAKQKEELE